MPRQKTLGLEGSKHKQAYQKQDRNVHFPTASSNRRYHHDKPTKQHTIITPLKVPAPAHQNPAQKPVVSPQPSQPQTQQDATSPEAPLEKRTDDNTNNPPPTDPITSKRTLNFIEDLLTPFQTVPMDISYNVMENARDAGVAPQRADDWLLPTSRELQEMFDEWLAPMTPEEEGSECIVAGDGEDGSLGEGFE